MHLRSYSVAALVVLAAVLMSSCSLPGGQPPQSPAAPLQHATVQPQGATAQPQQNAGAPPQPSATALPAAQPTAPPQAAPTGQPEDVARQFSQAWERADYGMMYGMLSAQAKGTITQDRFTGRYRAIMGGVAVTKIATSLGQGQVFGNLASGSTAKVPITVTLSSARVGDIVERNDISLVAEGGAWRVAWTPDLIFRDLTANNVVRVDPEDPARGAILDRKGRVLAGPGFLASVGVVPGNIKDEAKVLQALSDFLGTPSATIKVRYTGANPDWWVPLRDLPPARRDEARTKLANIAGIEVRDKSARAYPQGQIAAHVVGYISPATSDDIAQRAAEGYEEGDFIGRTGIELWAERDLAGQKGGKVVIADADGNTVRVVAQRKAQAGVNVQLTLDLDVQQQAEKALGDKTGSVVVLDPRDNAILALVSHPAFDPNAFVTGISDADWQRLSNDLRRPFQNRATLSAYATGSIFKVITMAAGLEKGGYKPDSPFECTGTWTGLPGVVLRDWLPEGHGKLTLQEGLTTSCNIVFYELGKKLNEIDSAILPDFAHQFGLGAPTGLVGLPEAKGTVPDPSWKQQNVRQPWYPGDAVNLAIGQGYLEATPLQMANVYAVLARNGERRAPVLISRVGDARPNTGAAPPTRLALAPDTLRSIRDGMVGAASSPRGTAYYAFQGFKVPTAAKTGSAENQNPEAHAWFAAYAPAETPEIVALVMVEGGRAGGEVAAPIGRRIMDAYFAGR